MGKTGCDRKKKRKPVHAPNEKGKINQKNVTNNQIDDRLILMPIHQTTT